MGLPSRTGQCRGGWRSRMSARSVSVWHRCAWLRCRRLFRPRETNQAYCCHGHYGRARRVEPARRLCALAECGREMLVGGTTPSGRRRADRRQRFHSRHCAAVARERLRPRRCAVPRLSLRRRVALAFALDGEGWVSPDGWVVEIGNTDRRWLVVLRGLAGNAGRIREDRGHRRRPHWKRFWRWRVYGASACALLDQCMGELLIKRARAERLVNRYRSAHPEYQS